MRVRRLPLTVAGLIAAGLAAGCAAPGAPGAPAGRRRCHARLRPAARISTIRTRTPIVRSSASTRTSTATSWSRWRMPIAPCCRRRCAGRGAQFSAKPERAGHLRQRCAAGPARARRQHVRAAWCINTTIGIGGMFDVATQIGVPYHSNDLGITLATWGIAEGPYIIVPVLGPSNPRDLIGEVGDSFADPGDYVAGQHHLIVGDARRATRSPASTSARATSKAWPISSAPRSIIMRRSARCTGSAARRRSATSSSNLPNPGSLGRRR